MRSGANKRSNLIDLSIVGVCVCVCMRVCVCDSNPILIQSFTLMSHSVIGKWDERIQRRNPVDNRPKKLSPRHSKYEKHEHTDKRTKNEYVRLEKENTNFAKVGEMKIQSPKQQKTTRRYGSSFTWVC